MSEDKELCEVISNMEDQISKAGLEKLREIKVVLDDLKDMADDHILAIAGQGGDF